MECERKIVLTNRTSGRGCNGCCFERMDTCPVDMELIPDCNFEIYVVVECGGEEDER